MRAQDVSPDVRQSAFALVGDLARVAAPHLGPAVPDLLALGVANLQPAMLRADTMSACNNACWSLGARSKPPRRRASCFLQPNPAHLPLQTNSC
jgi:hypothetical protein